MAEKFRMKVLLDAGHGIDTKGKRSPDGKLREYRYCREVVSEVCRRLIEEGIDAEILVSEEKDISPDERCRRVNAFCKLAGPDNVCLISVHNNASGLGNSWMSARGWEAWTSKGETQGDKLAECLYDAAVKYLPTGTKIRMDMADGDRDKEQNFAILKNTKCAACLTENLFQDNQEDVAWLLSDVGFEAIVRLHVEGIKAYLTKFGKR